MPSIAENRPRPAGVQLVLCGVWLLSLVASPAGLSGTIPPCPAAPAADSANATPLGALAFLVGGTWTSEDTLRLVGALPFQPTVRYEWAAEGRLIRSVSWRRGLDGTVRPNNEGFFFWRSEDCVVTHVLVFPDGGRIEGDYREPERAGQLVTTFTYYPAGGGPSRWRSEIERLGPDRIREVAFRWNGTKWQRMTDLSFVRSTLPTPSTRS